MKKPSTKTKTPADEPQIDEPLHTSRVERLLTVASECPTTYMLAVWNGTLYHVFAKGVMAGLVLITAQNVMLYRVQFDGDDKMTYFNRMAVQQQKEIMDSYVSDVTTLTSFDADGNVIKSQEIRPADL